MTATRPDDDASAEPRYLSVCSGIEAASCALEPLGFTPVGFAEIDKAASRVLAHHYMSNMPGEPLARNGVPNFGDFTTIPTETLGAVDWLIGGTPCQAFSVAGKRLSLADARGNLTLSYVALAHELARSNGLRGCLWENVPGVLNTSDNAFGCFLGALVGHDAAFPQPRGAGWPSSGMADGPRGRAAWIVRDAQYFGLAQRRKRVFVVGSFDGRTDPAAILFERQGVPRHPPSRRQAGQGIAAFASSSIGSYSEIRRSGGTIRSHGGDYGGGSENLVAVFGGGNRSGPVEHAATLTAKGQRCDFEVETFIACQRADSLTVGANQTTGFVGDVIEHTLRGVGFDASEDGTGRSTPTVPICFSAKDYGADAAVDLSPTLRAGGFTSSHANAGVMPAIAFAQNSLDEVRLHGDGDICVSLAAEPGMKQTIDIAQGFAFDLRGQEGGAMPEGPHDTANIRAASGGSSRSYVAQQWAVRRLLPVECERLQGFPDGWTEAPDAGGKIQADGPRYKQLGNSMAVPCIKWIGERILADHARAAMYGAAKEAVA